MGIAMDDINQHKDYLTDEEVLQFLDHHLAPNSYFLNKVVNVKQLGIGKVKTTDKGKDLPRSAPFILKFETKEARNDFWTEASKSKRPWQTQDSSILEYQEIISKLNSMAKKEKDKGRLTRIRYYPDHTCGMRYALESKASRNERWQRTFEEPMAWEEGFDQF